MTEGGPELAGAGGGGKTGQGAETASRLWLSRSWESGAQYGDWVDSTAIYSSAAMREDPTRSHNR